MIPTTNNALYLEALACLKDHKKKVGRSFKGRFVQIFLGLKFFQNSVPSMFSGQYAGTELLQRLLDDLFAKISRPANDAVLSLFENNYLARTGLTKPGNSGAQNTWRNNFNLQKGIGCFAGPADLSSPTFLAQPRVQCQYLVPKVAGSLNGAKCALSNSGAAYRNESHQKWLKMEPSGGQYATTDLQNIGNFAPYLAPAGQRIPLAPLIIALYHDADPGLAVGGRPNVGLVDFGVDFHLSTQEILAYFDDSMSHPLNARLAAHPAWPVGAGLTGSASIGSAVATKAAAKAANAPLPAPVLGGTPTPPPTVNSGWHAEDYVARALAKAGWTPHRVGNQQLGYDIFAQKGVSQTVRGSEEFRWPV